MTNPSNRPLQCGISRAFHNKDILDGDKRHLSNFPTIEQSIVEFSQHVREGGAFSLACFKDGHRKRENFKRAELVGLDLDKNISIERLLSISFIRNYAFLIYETASSTPDYSKTRVLIRLETPLDDLSIYETLLKGLQEKVKDLEPDSSCKDGARFFYGSDVGNCWTNFEATLPNAEVQQLIQGVVMNRKAQPVKRGNPKPIKKKIYCNSNWADLPLAQRREKGYYFVILNKMDKDA